ncbi:unnamed protein product [Urochloa decumbens]|uniref:F-box domain-containing protein n=1 Tax=Urochloa decumbens TaxID=240449 RepID=A0ABC9G8E8_9POAL
MAPHRRPCEKRRVPDATVAAAADTLLFLPTEVLDEILDRLHLRDAVRTSALSRAWRRRWESLPSLSLSFLDLSDTSPEVVDSVLVRYAGRIPRFSFRLHRISVDRLHDWLLAFSRRGIESIRLESTFHFRLHSCIFSCVHLVFLEVHECRMPSLPEGFAGFPVLKELKLLSASYSRRAGVANWRLSLVVHLRSVSWSFVVWRSPIKRVAQVRKLTINTCYPPFLGGNLLDTFEYTFVNLRSLFICTHFRETHAVLSTLCLLRSAPNLEELEIEIEGNQNQQQEIEANAEFQNTEWTNGLSANLQVVKMDGIGCLSNEMCFIELVLSKARVLRTMFVTLSDRSSKSIENALIELNIYRRASSHAQVFFKGSDSS